MPAWKGYQEETAAYYRDLGLSAETDAPLEGARAHHKADVAVRGQQPGVEFLWIVECKYWNRSVDKSVVSTLMTIVQDVGADRGIILSKRGFQAGATAQARNTNITLTSLEELRADAHDEYIEYQCAMLRQRCKAVVDRGNEGVEVVTAGDPWSGGLWSMTMTGGLDYRLRGRISMLESAVEVAARDNWPIDVVVVADEVERQVRAHNMDDLRQIVANALAAIEDELGFT
jgi:hypothetical protein